MAAKKAKKQATVRKSAGSTPRKQPSKKASTKRSAPGLMSQATKVVRTVVTSAAEAVQGAIESGKRVTGLGQGGNKPQGKK